VPDELEEMHREPLASNGCSLYDDDMTIAEVGERIEGVSVPVSPAGLREAVAVRDLLDARIAVAVGEFDALGLADEDCGLGTKSWLQHHAKVDAKAAGRLTALGRRLHRFALLRAAALDGSLSAGQLAIVTACVPERHFDRFAEHEALVVDSLVGLGIEGTRVLLQSWLARADAVDDGPEPRERPNEVRLSPTLDGCGELRGSLDADHTAVLDAAFRAADCGDRDLTKAHRNAEALDAIARFFLDHHGSDPRRRNRPHVNVVMSEQQLHDGSGGTYLDTGQPVSRTAAEVLRCDSELHRVLVDSEGAILDYGRATRAWRPDIAAAIQLRDQGCRWEGCDAPADRCHIHHVDEWVRDNGETTFWDGFMGCSRHHHLIHRLGLEVKLLADGTVHIALADGRVLTSRPRGPTSPHLWDPPDGRRPGGS
jgi:hypothetical protein